MRIVDQGPVRTFILERPHVRNAVDRETSERLRSAFLEFEGDDTVRIAVLWGEGGHFCAGADLKELASLDLTLTHTGVEGPMGPTRLLLSKPVIAAVAGYCVAGGLELALWCDLRVAEENAVFGVFNRRWGVPLIDGGTVRLPRIVGMGRALEMILTGRPVTASEALTWGLVNRVVPTGQARAEAEKWAHQIASFPPICLTHDRLSTYEQSALSLADALRNEAYHGTFALIEEAGEGARNFAAGAGRHGIFANSTSTGSSKEVTVNRNSGT